MFRSFQVGCCWPHVRFRLRFGADMEVVRPGVFAWGISSSRHGHSIIHPRGGANMLISDGKTKVRMLVALALSISLTAPVWADTFTGPVSKYYLDGGTTIYIVQGARVVETFPTVYGQGQAEGVLAVSETIRTRARDTEQVLLEAGEYTLSGVPTGHSYLTPLQSGSGGSVYDGTSDGLNNYYVLHSGLGLPFGGVYGTDYYWQNPGELFSAEA